MKPESHTKDLMMSDEAEETRMWDFSETKKSLPKTDSKELIFN